MSLFPIRLRPGGTITVHLRFAAKFPGWVSRKDYLIDPKGGKSLCYERTLPCIPPSKKSLDELELIIKSEQILGGAPLLMAARYLQNDFKRTDYFLDMLVGLRDETHHYYTLKIPEDALLGRYHFELEDRMNGRVFKSKTFDTDYFLVEKLDLIKITTHGGNFIAFIENSSPEPVLAELCQFSADLNKEYEPRIIQLAPQSVSEIPFQEAGILMYRDRDDFLRLSTEKACLRNPIFQSVFKQGSLMIFSNDPTCKQAFELQGEAKEIWQHANGFFSRSHVRTQANSKRYDEMLQAGLIIEID